MCPRDFAFHYQPLPKALVRRGLGRYRALSKGTCGLPSLSRSQGWKVESKDALCEMPGKTFWAGDAKDFEAPIKQLAAVQVMVFPSPQLPLQKFSS